MMAIMVVPRLSTDSDKASRTPQALASRRKRTTEIELCLSPFERHLVSGVSAPCIGGLTSAAEVERADQAARCK
jgi:hypothetical protein